MSAQNPFPHWRRRLFSPQAFVRLALLTALAPLLGLFGEFHWFLDLFNHLQAQYFVSLLLILLVLIIWRKPRHTLLALLTLAIPAFHLTPLYWPNHPSIESPRLRVATYNVLSSNNRYEEAIDWIRDSGAEIVHLPECNARWVEALIPLDETLPHHLRKIVPGNFGFSFHSKHPILSHRIHRSGQLEIPLLEALIKSPHGELTVLGCHPVPPVSGLWASERDIYLSEIHRLAARSKGRVVVLGDLNATRWSHSMKPLLADFEDTQAGHGFSATWMRSNWLVTIPIDHILARGFSGTFSRKTGPELGSDHRPIIADLAW